MEEATFPTIRTLSSQIEIESTVKEGASSRLSRPTSTILDSQLIEAKRRKLLSLVQQEVEDKNYKRFFSTPTRPRLIPESDKVMKNFSAPVGPRDLRLPRPSGKRKQSNFLKLFQPRGLHLKLQQLCSTNTVNFAGIMQADLKRFNTEKTTFDVALDDLVLNATHFNKQNRLKVGHRKKLLNQESKTGKQPVSAFTLNAVTEQQTQHKKKYHMLYSLYEDTQKKEDSEDLLGAPINGLDSDKMGVEELRFIHISALRFLHHYINTFKIFSVDAALTENQPLEKELTEISTKYSGDQIIELFKVMRCPSKPEDDIPSESSKEEFDGDLDGYLLNNQETFNWTTTKEQNMEKLISEMKLEDQHSKSLVVVNEKDGDELSSIHAKSLTGEHLILSPQSTTPSVRNQMSNEYFQNLNKIFTTEFQDILEESSDYEEKEEEKVSYQESSSKPVEEEDLDFDFPRANTNQIMSQISKYIKKNTKKSPSNLGLEWIQEEEMEEGPSKRRTHRKTIAGHHRRVQTDSNPRFNLRMHPMSEAPPPSEEPQLKDASIGYTSRLKLNETHNKKY